MAPRVKVYSSPNCPYCDAAKRLLKQRSVPFEEVQLGWDDDQLWADLFKKSGMRTAPQIFVDEKILGGYTDLAALDAQDQLKSLV